VKMDTCRRSVCSKPFPAARSQRYCCKACAAAEKSDVRAARRRAKAPYVADFAERRCEGCGVAFKPAGSDRAIHCSIRCARHARYLRSKPTYVNHPHRPCAVCGTSFKPRAVDTRMCSVACRNVVRAKAQRVRRMPEGGKRCARYGCSNVFEVGSRPDKRFCCETCKIKDKSMRQAKRNAGNRAGTPYVPVGMQRKPRAGKPSRQGLPCATCMHGKPSEHAELGWECGITRALTCKPLIGATLYAARLETGT
jgi:predicted nucleic acid-binding Zn ribbon protein